MTLNPYDAVPYKSYPFPQSHPERLATIAHLFGVGSAPLEACRVLEIGCAAGGNLIPMACRSPGSEFIGVDLSGRQVEEGEHLINEIGLSNISLRQNDLRRIDESYGEFDYIIAHGIYSWIPDEAQKAMLQVSKSRLARNGIVYVSYNTYPGWHMRGMIRDIMSYRVRDIGSLEERVRQARAVLNFLAESVPTEDNAYGMLLNKELETLQDKADYYLLHEHLEEHNKPEYFYQFATKAAEYGLKYLAEADFSVMAIENFSASIESMLKTLASDLIETEQYMDFVRNRMFRQTLLCHNETAIDRKLTPDRLLRMHVASPTKPAEAIDDLQNGKQVTFRAPGSVTNTSDPIVKAALLTLGQRWPNPLPFTELLAIAKSLASNSPSIIGSVGNGDDVIRLAQPLLRCYATGHVSLTVSPPPVATEVSERPTAYPLARHQARRSNEVTSLRHETVRLSDIESHMLCELNGENDSSTITDNLHTMCDNNSIVVRDSGSVVSDPIALRKILSAEVDKSLCRFAASALLTD